MAIRCAVRPARRDLAGYSLLELIVVLAVVAALVLIATPRLQAFVASSGARAAANRVATDLYYARMVAASSGQGASIRFHNAPECPLMAGARVGGFRYTISTEGPSPRPLRTVSVRDVSPRACIYTNGSDRLGFNSRGMVVPFGNRTIWSSVPPASDSLVISVLGRVRRAF